MTFKIKLRTVASAIIFSAKCNEYPCDIDISRNRFVIDAKSLVGVIGLGLDDVCTAKVHSSDTKLLNKFKSNMNPWISEDARDEHCK